MSTLQQAQPRGRFSLVGIAAVLATTVGLGAWVWADASDPKAQPPALTKGNVASVSLALNPTPETDPLVVVMDSWEETKAKNTNTASKKKKKKKKNNNFFELYLFSYFFFLQTPGLDYQVYNTYYNQAFFNYYNLFTNPFYGASYNAWFELMDDGN